MMSNDPYHLQRFIEAQKGVYDRVREELRSGHKVSHWMWFIFPQIRGLGHTETSIHFAISSVPEAQAYLQHPLLGSRLVECAEIVLDVKERSANQIFGFPDDLKLQSSMTLFAQVSKSNPRFRSVLDRYFDGKPDSRTLQLLAAAR